MLLFWLPMGLVYDFPTWISVSFTSQKSTKKSLNQFCFLLILDDFRALCLTAALNFFDNQKIWQKCDLLRPSRMILLNPFRYESSFNVGYPLKIWTKNDSFSSKRCHLKTYWATKLWLVLNERFFIIFYGSAFISILNIKV